MWETRRVAPSIEALKAGENIRWSVTSEIAIWLNMIGRTMENDDATFSETIVELEQVLSDMRELEPYMD